VLVLGAGRDLVVPPEESLHFAAAVGDLATLVWYPTGSHGLYEFIADWTRTTAIWLRSMLAPEWGLAPFDSTRVEDRFPGIGTVEGVFIDESGGVGEEENVGAVAGESESDIRPPREDPAFIGETPTPPVAAIETLDEAASTIANGTPKEAAESSPVTSDAKIEES
jgi:hypothetical protein